MKLIDAFLLLFVSVSVNSQTCNFDSFYEAMNISQTDLNSSNQAIHDFIYENKEFLEFRKNYVIPVVVHIVWRVPKQDISDIQIYSQIESLNRDFSGSNPEAKNLPDEFKQFFSTIEIEFCLTSVDTEGNPSSGITRTQTTVENIGTSNHIYDSSQGGVYAWDTKKYLNIWVCEFPKGILGFGSLPNSVGPEKDGIIVSHKNFGTAGTAAFEEPYHLGRTLTHEVGHYLNLLHPWGHSKGECEEDDLVNDTPIQSNTYKGCPSYPMSTCGENEMTMNFMNEVDDNCMAFFTNGQRERMIASLLLFREELIDGAGCTKGEYLTNEKVLIFPNPTKNWVNIFVGDPDLNMGHVEIFDIHGRLYIVIEIHFNSIYPIDLRSLTNGIYFMKITSLINGKATIKKFTIDPR